MFAKYIVVVVDVFITFGSLAAVEIVLLQPLRDCFHGPVMAVE